MSIVDSIGRQVVRRGDGEGQGIDQRSDGEVRGLAALILVFAGLKVPRVAKVLGVGRSQIYLDMSRARQRLASPDERESLAG